MKVMLKMKIPVKLNKQKLVLVGLYFSLVSSCYIPWRLEMVLIILVASMFTFGFSNLVFCFIYNKLYINDLLSQGYKAADEYSLLLYNKNIVA